MTKRVNPAKASIVETLKDLLSKSKSVAIVNYTGLKVSQATQLRSLVKQAGGRVVIAKNTLFQIALGKDLDLSGANAFIFAVSDEVSPLKAVADFAKKNPAAAGPVFKSGILGDRILSASEVTQLSSIPDRTTNYQLLTTHLKSPIFNLAFNLNWPIKRTVLSLKGLSFSRGVKS